MLSRIYRACPVVTAVTTLLPESECKGKANFGTGKQIEKFFSQKTHLFFNIFYLSLILRILRKLLFSTKTSKKTSLALVREETAENKFPTTAYC